MNNQTNQNLMDLCTELLISRAFSLDNPRIYDIVDQFYVVLDGDFCEIIDDITKKLNCNTSFDRFKDAPGYTTQKAIQIWIDWLNRWCKYA